MPTIRLWPPPREPRTVTELIDAAERRDPTGHGLHLILAGLFCAFGGVATSTLEISSALLILYAIARLPNTWRIYPTLVTTWSWLGLTAWSAWTFATVLWSADRTEGAVQCGGFRMFLAIPALWPVIRHRRGLATCLVAGMCFQALGVALSYFGLIGHGADGLNRHVGFGSHAGHVTLWLSIAAITAIALVRGAGPAARWFFIAAAGALIVAATTAGGRGSLLGLGSAVARHGRGPGRHRRHDGLSARRRSQACRRPDRAPTESQRAQGRSAQLDRIPPLLVAAFPRTVARVADHRDGHRKLATVGDVAKRDDQSCRSPEHHDG